MNELELYCIRGSPNFPSSLWQVNFSEPQFFQVSVRSDNSSLFSIERGAEKQHVKVLAQGLGHNK